MSNEKEDNESAAGEREMKLYLTHQKKISRMVFFARRGDFKISKMVALSVWLSIAVKFLCKHDKMNGCDFVSRSHVPALCLIINLTYNEDIEDARIGALPVDLRYPPELLHHFVYSAVGDEPS